MTQQQSFGRAWLEGRALEVTVRMWRVEKLNILSRLLFLLSGTGWSVCVREFKAAWLGE